jgi:hypothetical protein
MLGSELYFPAPVRKSGKIAIVVRRVCPFAETSVRSKLLKPASPGAECKDASEGVPAYTGQSSRSRAIQLHRTRGLGTSL